MNYYLDTNICVYYLKAVYPALRLRILALSPSDIKIPAVVKAELLCGAEKSIKRDYNRAQILSFLSPLDIVPFDDAASVQYASIRATLEKAGTPIGPNDLMIAATVLAHDGILITNNLKEFSRVPRLILDSWMD
jgi:tRNA(fMet)-specific endonuclease VapC